MLPVYVMTCDKYINTLKPFFYLFSKYWGEWQPVTVVGFQPPPFDLPDNATFLSLGVDEGVNKWSDGLIKLCEIIPDPIFVLFFEDYFLVRPVYTSVVYTLWDFQASRDDILKFDLCAERLHAAGSMPYGGLNGVELIQSDPNSAYHMSLYLGMWRRDLLRQVLIPNETPWDVEISGTNRLRDFGESALVIGTTSEPCKITLGHRFGDVSQMFLDELSEEDRLELTQNGLV